MHLKKVLKLLYNILFFIALIMLIPAGLALIWKEYVALKAFLFTTALMSVFCICLRCVSGKSDMQHLSQRDGFLITTLTWAIAAAFGAIPFVLTKTLPCYSSAFFEVISGFTTTGSTKLTDIESCFRSILFWRSLTNWLGGMGIVVLFIAILPALDSNAGAFNLMGAETVGPVKSKLTSKTSNTATILWTIYLGLTLAQIFALLCGGLPLFDSVTIAFSTVSTAGFSIKNASIGAYNSLYVDIVVMFFMFCASLNFTVYYKLIHGQFRETAKDSELKVFTSVVFAASLIGALFLRCTGFYKTFTSALRYMAFHVISIISTTGFSNANILLWQPFALGILVLMMFIGGCAGSTGGGIKVMRIHILFLSARNAIRKKNHPNSVSILTISGENIQDDTILSVFTFCVIYIVTWLISSVIISLCGADIRNCLSATLLSLGNIGLGFGDKSFSSYPEWTNWIFSFLMLSGRLELMTVYVLFSRSFWKR